MANCRHGNDSRNGIRERNVRTEITRRNVWYYTSEPSGIPRYFDFCHFLIYPMGHAQHLRRVHISRDKWLSGNTIADIGTSIQDDREYRGLSVNIEEAGGQTGAEGGGRRNWKSPVSAAISLSILYYRLNITWKRCNVIRNKSLFVAFSINSRDGTGTIVFIGHQLQMAIFVGTILTFYKRMMRKWNIYNRKILWIGTLGFRTFNANFFHNMWKCLQIVLLTI